MQSGNFFVFGITVLVLCSGINTIPMRMDDDTMQPPHIWDDPEATPSSAAEVTPVDHGSSEAGSTEATEVNDVMDWAVLWSEYFTDSMAYQCSGTGAVQLQPAIELFACLETEPSGSLFSFFGSTGLNLTQWRQELVARSQAQVDSKIRTPGSSVYIGNTGLAALLRQIATHANDLCLNTDAFMDCMYPYLQACFASSAIDTQTVEPSTEAVPSSDSMPSTNSSLSDDPWLVDFLEFLGLLNANVTLSTNQAAGSTVEPEVQVTTEATTSSDSSSESSTEGQNRTRSFVEEIDIILFSSDTGSTATTDDSSSNGTTESSVYQNDDKHGKKEDETEAPRGFFGLPYITNADKISAFLRRELQILCVSNSDVATAPALPVTGVLSGLPCLLSQKVPSPCRLEGPTDDDEIVDKNSIKCILDEVHDYCSADGADTMQAMVDEYVEDAKDSMQTTTDTPTTPQPAARTNSSSTSWFWLFK